MAFSLGSFLSIIGIATLISSLFLLLSNSSYILEIALFHFLTLEVQAILFVDWIRIIFLAVVIVISGSVLRFRQSYIADDFFYKRFTWIVIAFVIRIALLILRLNIISLLLGWDGLGVVSFALIIYYNNENSRRAGIITAMSNRIGDVAILLVIALIAAEGGWNFIYISTLINDPLIIFLVILASITKRAQIPFSAWLPAAIAAPTPVRALVHSSTLVTAGVYLLIRFHPALNNINITLLTRLAIITSILARIRACFEIDLKKIVALSTLSQLGFIVTTLRLNLPTLTFFHLVTHAFLKALLFVCRGKIIHENEGAQNIQFIGHLASSLPLTLSFFNLSNFSLCGLPFLSGFFSKDAIIENILSRPISTSLLLGFSLIVGLSSVYSRRLFICSSFIPPSNPLKSLQDEDKFILFAFICLGTLAAISGAGLSWLIFPSPEIRILPPILKILALSCVLLGLTLGIFMRNFKLPLLSHSLEYLSTLNNLPLFSGYIAISPAFSLRHKIKLLDFGWSELLRGEGAYSVLSKASLLNPWRIFTKIFFFQLISVRILIFLYFI